MAENEDKKTESKEQSSEQAKPKTGIVTWIIMGVVILLFTGSGFLLGKLIAKPSEPAQTDPNVETTPQQQVEEEKQEQQSSNKTGQTWYYNELESVVVNPDEPGATRFVRVGLILEMDASISEDKATALIQSKKPPLINWLNLYFKSLTLGEMKDDSDIKRILLQICDAFNEILFPDAKPQIQKILIREFNIQ